MSTTIKCLSVRPPWGLLIVRGEKDVENRDWGTNFRGPLLIHQSKTLDELGETYLMRRGVALPKSYDLGCIIGAAVVVDCTRVERSEWHVHGQFGWYLESPIRFKDPIPWRGQLGLFDVPISAVRELTLRLEQRGMKP